MIEHNLQTITRSRSALFQDTTISDDDLKQINQLSPTELNAEQVYIRSMFLCSSQPCDADGCQFTIHALQQIARLIIGQSVLSGHNRSSLPLARFYKAQVVQRGTDNNNEPVYYVQAWFYWLRDTTGAKDLLLNIDGGIYREVSLAWKFNAWRCSICLADNGRCDHQVGEIYNGKTCYRLIDQVTDVLEGSLVYKSADKNTFLTHAHMERSENNFEPLLLVCRNDDPLLTHLQNFGVVTEAHPLDEIQESFHESVELLWLRSDSHEEIKTLSQNLLAPSGICLADHKDSPRLFYRSNEGIGEIIQAEERDV